ncbi:ABC-type glycerol-3-phosphate transport system, substrate-binding protein [Gracilibacillus orientalis]|uniref:ABC-type glycerol-3-phosphate transport system, substrate-binding protein n=1 Tax=Gracilibacillus orientalis TaxID=334253 RepID=A0A1I4GSE5_9BACI|nr:sugar ABC transporter substrate-binding protein [Gracilibacillus orientalis]SFL33002.1 ABC-type glycerol-3-phosphate transport system, substrate-binding protein [Gracilibacillus orientalis]
MKKYLLLLLIIFISVGCSSNDSSSSESNGSSDNGDGTTLEVWWNVDQGEDRSGYYDAIEKYQELNQEVNINVQVLPYEQLKQKLTTSSANGNPPDIAQGLAEWMADLNSMGTLHHLTDFVNEWDEKDSVPQAVWDSVTMNEEIVAFPSYIGTRARMYHEDIINEADVALPETWEDLLTVGKELKEAGIENPFGISATSARAPQELAVYMWSNNLEIAEEISDGAYQNTWQEDESQLERATEVFQFYKDMLEQGIISQNQTSWGYQELDQNFAQGRVAITQNGPWIQGYEEEQPEGMEDVRVDGVPPYNETPATFLEVAQWYVFEDSDQKEAALEFLKWMGSKEGQSIYAKGNRTIRNDMDSEGEWNVAFTEIAEHGRSWPAVPMGGIIDAMTESIQKVLLGDTTPEETAIWLSDQINQSLEENNLLSE